MRWSARPVRARPRPWPNSPRAGWMRTALDQVALVAADAFRVGAAAQLTVYADLLGVSLYVADRSVPLGATAAAACGQKIGADRHRGLCPVGSAYPRRVQALDAFGVRRVAVISANQQGAAIEQAMARFRRGRGCLHPHQARRNAAAGRRARQPDSPSPAAGLPQRWSARAGRPSPRQCALSDRPRAERWPAGHARMRWRPKTGRCSRASRPSVPNATARRALMPTRSGSRTAATQRPAAVCLHLLFF